MIKKLFVPLAVLALGAALLAPVGAADAAKLSTIAPVEDVVAEIAATVTEVETALSSNDNYLKAKKKTLPQAAGLLALLSQAVALHDEASDLKAGAPALRDGALALRKADTLDSAKKALAQIKDAQAGKAAAGTAEPKWEGLIDMDSLMSEVNVRNGKLRRTARKLPDDTATAARDASVMAILALAIEADTHEVKNAGDVPKWQGYAKDLSAEMAKTAAAIKAKDLEGTKSAFLASAKSCSSCHNDFRDN